MTTPLELKDSLIRQYNDLSVQLQRIEGAIAACETLCSESDKETDEEEE